VSAIHGFALGMPLALFAALLAPSYTDFIVALLVYQVMTPLF
jgi:hypothetical protein